MPDEDKTFTGSLVFDLSIWWHHVHTLHKCYSVFEPPMGPFRYWLDALTTELWETRGEQGHILGSYMRDQEP